MACPCAKNGFQSIVKNKQQQTKRKKKKKKASEKCETEAVCGFQSPKYLLYDPLQRKFADLCSKGFKDIQEKIQVMLTDMTKKKKKQWQQQQTQDAHTIFEIHLN